MCRTYKEDDLQESTHYYLSGKVVEIKWEMLSRQYLAKGIHRWI